MNYITDIIGKYIQDKRVRYLLGPVHDDGGSYLEDSAPKDS